MAIRVSGALVTKFNEALRASVGEITVEVDEITHDPACDCTCDLTCRVQPLDLTHRQVADLVERMKYDLAAVLLAPGAGALEINVPDRTNMLDSESSAT